jgi:hypothetical protein
LPIESGQRRTDGGTEHLVCLFHLKSLGLDLGCIAAAKATCAKILKLFGALNERNIVQKTWRETVTQTKPRDFVIIFLKQSGGQKCDFLEDVKKFGSAPVSRALRSLLRVNNRERTSPHPSSFS